MKKLKVAINGLGRIGKCIFRTYFENFDHYADKIDIVAVNAGTAGIEDRIHGIKYDSIHGKFKKEIEILDNSSFLVGKDYKIKMLFERNIELINWRQLDIDVVLECTGAFNKNSEAHKHISHSNAKKVIVSAPYSSADATIVMGVNEKDFDPLLHNVISISSCTTNCLAIVAKILNDQIGIESGFVTTIHAYTNDQLILDGGHSDRRRSRAAAISAIPSSTGAAKSINLVVPELRGKLGGAAIRIPTANVSMIDLKFLAKRVTSVYEINNIMQLASAHIPDFLGITDEELVSCDFNHTRHSAIFDTTLTNVVNDNFCRVAAWYDNEWGFANRMLDIAKIFSSSI